MLDILFSNRFMHKDPAVGLAVLPTVVVNGIVGARKHNQSLQA